LKKNTKAIKRYTKTLFSMVEISEVEKVISDISKFYQTANTVNNVKSVLVNPLFTEEDRVKLLDILAATLKLSSISVKFLKKVIELGAYTELPNAINTLTKLYFDAKNMSKAVITTSVKMSEQLKKLLTDTLSDKFKRKFELECLVDTGIVGGVVVKIDSNLYDLSTRGQLRLIKESLLSGRVSTSNIAPKVAAKDEPPREKPHKDEPPKVYKENVMGVTNYLSDKLAKDDSSEDWQVDFKKI